jgi:hypothetical protein
VKKVVIGLMLFCVSAAQADIVVSYDYNSAAGKDPTLQYWTFTRVTDNVENGSHDAGTGWRIADAIDPGYTRYDKTFTQAQADELNKGWIANWTFSLDSDKWSNTGTKIKEDYYVPGTIPTLQNDSGLSICTASTAGEDNAFRYCLFATADLSGNLAINDGTTLHVLTSGGNGFDKMTSVRIVYDGEDARMYYGGQTFNLNKSVDYDLNRVRFGSQNLNSVGRGSVVYNAITLSTIPEPTTMVLLGLGGLLLRRRKA